MESTPRVRAPFFKVSCACGNEQVIFSRAATKVACTGCSEILAEPTGGRAKVNGDIVETLQ